MTRTGKHKIKFLMVAMMVITGLAGGVSRAQAQVSPATSDYGLMTWVNNSAVFRFKVWEATAFVGGNQNGPALQGTDVVRHLASAVSDNRRYVGVVAETLNTGTNVHNVYGTVWDSFTETWINTTLLWTFTDAANIHLRSFNIVALSNTEFVVVGKNDVNTLNNAGWIAGGGWTVETALSTIGNTAVFIDLARRPGTGNILLCAQDEGGDAECRYYTAGAPYGQSTDVNNDWTTNTQISATADDASNWATHSFFDPTNNTRGGIVHNAGGAGALDIRTNRFTVTGAAFTPGNTADSANMGDDANKWIVVPVPGQTYGFVGAIDIDEEFHTFRTDVSPVTPTWTTIAQLETDGGMFATGNDINYHWAMEFDGTRGLLVYSTSDAADTVNFRRWTIGGAFGGETNVTGSVADTYNRIMVARRDQTATDEIVYVMMNNDVDIITIWWDGSADAFAAGTRAWTEQEAGLSTTIEDSFNGLDFQFFREPQITISGTVFSGEGAGGISGVTVRVAVDGVDFVNTDDTNANGFYSISSIPVDIGDVITVYLEDETQNAAVVTVVNRADITDMDMYQNRLILRHDNSGSLTNANLNTGIVAGENDVTGIYSVSGGNLTVTGTAETFVWSGDTFAPGGQVTAGAIDINGSLTMGSNRFTISGTWDATGGSFTATGGTVKFTNSSGNTIDIISNSSAFHNVHFSDSGGGTTFQLEDGLNVNGTLRIQGGTLDTKSGENNSITVSGNWFNTDIFVARSSTVTLNGATSLTLAPGSSAFFNLLINGSSGTYILEQPLDVDRDLTIAAGTLDTKATENNSINIGGSWTNSDNFLSRNATVTFDGTSSRTITSGGESFYNLDFDGSGGTWVLQDNLDVNGTLKITTGTLDANSSGNHDITLAGNWARFGIFIPRTGAVVLNGGDQAFTTSSTFYDLTKAVTTAATLTFEAGLTIGITHTMDFQGITGQLLGLVSSNPGVRFNLNVTGGTQSVTFVNASDSEALSNDIVAVLSVNGGNNDDTDTTPFWIFLNERYWVGPAGGNTNDPSNWSGSANACGVGGGAGVPTTSEVAVFSGLCDNSATVNAAFNVGGMSIESGYAGTVTPNALIDVDGPFSMAGGTINFETNDTDMNVSGNFIFTGGTYTPSTSAGVLTFDGTLTVNDVAGGTDLGVVTIDGTTNTVTLIRDLTVTDLTIATGDTLRTDGFELDINDDLDLNGILNAASGADNTTTISIAGDWDMTGGTFTNTSSTVRFDGTSNVTSNARAFNNIVIGGAGAGTLNTSDDLYIDGNLTVLNNGATTFNISGDTVFVSANLNFANLDTFTVANSTVRFDGTGIQTIASNSRTYNTIEVTNTSLQSVNFTQAFTTTNLFSHTPSANMKFQQSVTFTVSGSLDLVGINGGQIALNSIDGATQFNLATTAGTQNVEYVKVGNSNASSSDIVAANSTNNGGNDNAGPTPHWIFLTPDGAGSAIFTTAGATTWVVPCNVTEITVKTWGGGGGGASGGSVGVGGNGGGAGFATAVLTVTPGETLNIQVGGAGAAGALVGTGGGGGGGGGRSEVERGTTPLVVASGGGGGGGGDNSGSGIGGNGGPGGGLVGTNGSASGTANGGTGGNTTTLTGGPGGTGGTNAGTAGALEAGGNGGSNVGTGDGALGGSGGGGRAGIGINNNGAGGGGGSGRYGGGGGSSAAAGNQGGGGGGGGSSYLTGASTSTTSGAGTSAGNNTDSDYASNAGQGGGGGAISTAGTAGNTGRIVINFVAPAVDISGSSDLPGGTLIDGALDGVGTCGISGSVSGGVWTVNNAPILSGDVLVIWAEDGDGNIANADEASAVTQYDGTGNISGMVLNRHTLSVGSADNQTLTLAELAQFDQDNDEDIMFTATATTLTVDGTGAYNDDELIIFSGETLSLTAGQALLTHDLTIQGAISVSGAANLTVESVWDSSSGNFVAGSSTVTMTTSGTISTAAHSFNNLRINVGNGATTLLATAVDIGGKLTVSSGALDANDQNLGIDGNTVFNGKAFRSGTGDITFGDGTDTVIVTGGDVYIESDDVDNDITFNLSSWTNTSGTVRFEGSSSSESVFTSLSPYNNLIFNAAPGSAFTSNAAIDINGFFTLDGTLNMSANNNNLNIAGDITANTGAVVQAGTGVVTLDGSLSYQDNVGGINFGLLTISGTVSLDTTMTATSIIINNVLTTDGHDLDIAGTLDLNDTLDAASGTGGATDISIAGTLDMTGGTFVNTNSTVIFDGNSTVISAGESFFSIRVGSTTNGGTLTAADNLSIDGNLTVSSAGATVLNITGNTLTMSGAALNLTNLDSFMTANSTVIFDGTTTLTSATQDFLNIQIGTGIAGGSVTLADTMSIDGSFVVTDFAATTFNISNNTVIMSGISWDITDLDTFTTTNSTVTFDINSGTTVINSGDQAYRHVEFDDSGTNSFWQITGTMNVDGTFLVSDGTVDLAGSDPLLFVAGNFTVQTAGTFLVGINTVTFDGNLLFNDVDGLTNMGTLLVDPTTTMTSDMTCVSITIAAGDTLITDGYEIDCSRNITINGSLDASPGTDGATTINLGRSWTNNNIFIGTGSTVIFDGGGSRTITSGGDAFNNLRIDGAATWTLQDALDVNGWFELNAGTLDVSASNRQASFANNWTDNGGIFVERSGTVVFDGAVTQDITAGNEDFANILVTNSGTVAFLDDWSTVDFTAETPNSGLEFDAGSTYVISSDLNLMGASGQRIRLISNSTGTRFTLNVTGGDQNVSYVAVRDSQASTNDIYATNSLDNGNNDSFEAPSAQWIFVSGDGEYQWTGAFNAKTWENQGNWDKGDGSPGNDGYPEDADDKAIINSTNHNITTAGTITVGGIQLSGSFTGDVTLSGTTSFTVTNNGTFFGDVVVTNGTLIVGDTLDVEGTMSIAGTLDLSAVASDVSVSGTVLIDSGGAVLTGTGTFTLDGTTSYSYRDNSGIANLGKVDVTGTVNLDSDLIANSLKITTNGTLTTDGYDLDIAGIMNIDGNLDASDAGGRATDIYVGGLWNSSGGNFTATNSTVIFNGTTSLLTSTLETFHNIQIGGLTSGGSLTLESDSVTISGTLRVTDNGPTTFDINNRILTLSGATIDLTDLDTFTSTSSTVRVTLPVVTVTSAGHAFNNITIASGPLDGHLMAADDMDINGVLNALVPRDTTFDISGVTLYFAGSSFFLNNIDTFTNTNSTVVFDGTSTLTSGNNSLFNVQIGNGAGGSLTTADDMSIDGSLVVASGGSNTLNISDDVVTMSGTVWDMTNLTTFTNTNSTVIFDGITTLTSDTKSFLSVQLGTVTNGGTLITADDTSISGTFKILTADATWFDISDDRLFYGGDDWDMTNLDMFVSSNSTVIFDDTSGTNLITSAGKNFNHVEFDDSGGGATWQPQDALTINGTMKLTSGSLTGSQDVTVNGGNVVGNGTITMTVGGTFTVDGTGNFGSTTNWTFFDLTFGNGVGAQTTTASGTSTITIGGTLTIAANQALNAGSKTYTLQASGMPFIADGTFTYATSTVSYVGTSATAVEPTQYYNISLTPAATVTYSVIDRVGGTDVLDIWGDLTIGNGTDALTLDMLTNPAQWRMGGPGSDVLIETNVTLTTHQDTTLSFAFGSGSGAQTITDNTSPKQNLGFIAMPSWMGTGSSLTLNSSIQAYFMVMDSGVGAFNMGSNTMELTRGGTGTSRPLQVDGGTFNAGTGTVIYSGSSATTVEGTITYYNLGLGTVSDALAGVTYTLGGSTTVEGTLTIGHPTSTNTDTLEGDDKTLTLSGAGAPFNITGQGDFSPGTSTVNYIGQGATIVTSANYYNIGVGTTADALASVTYTFGGASDPSIDGTLTVGNLASTNVDYLDGADKLINFGAGGKPFNITSKGRFIPSTSQVSYLSFTQATTVTAATYYNLAVGFYSSGDPGVTFTLEGSTTVNSVLTVGNAASANEDVFDASDNILRLAGTGTPLNFTSRGSFEPSTSTVIYMGTGATNVTGTAYYNLYFAPTAGSPTYTLGTGVSQAINVNNDLVIGNGTNMVSATANSFDPVLDVNGTVTISTNGTLIASNAADFNVSGNWNNSANGSFIHSGGTVTFNGVAAQTISSNDSAFFHVEFDDGGAGATWSLAGTMNVDGTFLVSDGTVDLAANDPLLFVAGDFTVQTAGTFTVGTPTVTFNGNLLFNDVDGLTNMGTLLVDPTTTMTSDMTCVNLTIAAGDTLITDGYEIDCSGSITINGSLDASNGTDGRSNIFVGRSWTNNNIFISGNSLVTFDSTSGSRTITSTSVTGAFYNVTFNGASTWNLQDNMSIDGTLRLIAGTVDVTASDRQINLAGNWINTGATFTPQNGTVIFDGTIEQNLTAGASNFWGLLVTNAGTLNSLDDYSVENLTDVTPGSTLIFDAGSTYTINGILTLNGQAVGTRIILDSSVASTRFTFDVGAANPQTVFYVDVSNSEAAGSDINAFFSFDRFNNDSGEGTPQWVFPAAGPLRGAVMVVD